jgi:transcriptional regulator with XRE-family HTH domain
MSKEFGKYIKKLREDKKLTLLEVAEVIGLSYSYLSQIESGSVDMGTNTYRKLYRKLLKVYDISLEEFNTKSDPEIKRSQDFNIVLNAIPIT